MSLEEKNHKPITDEIKESKKKTALEEKWEKEEEVKKENSIGMIDQKTGELRRYNFGLSVFVQAVPGYYNFVKETVKQVVPELNNIKIVAGEDKNQFPVNFKFVAEELKFSKGNPTEGVIISE